MEDLTCNEQCRLDGDINTKPNMPLFYPSSLKRQSAAQVFVAGHLAATPSLNKVSLNSAD